MVSAINNGKNDIRDGKPFPEFKFTDMPNNATKYASDAVNKLSNDVDKNETVNCDDKFVNKLSVGDTSNVLLQKVVNSISKEADAAPPVDVEKQENVDSALLDTSLPVKQPRYGNSEIKQFFIILKRTLLFSRRDWVSQHFTFM